MWQIYEKLKGDDADLVGSVTDKKLIIINK